MTLKYKRYLDRSLNLFKSASEILKVVQVNFWEEMVDKSWNYYKSANSTFHTGIL